MNWAEVRVATTPEGIEILTGFLMAHGVNGVMIEDAGDFNRFLNDTTIHWDYVDEELMKMAHCETAVKFYLPDNPQGYETLNQIKADLGKLQADQEIDLGDLSVTISYQEEEDWETAWKKYYRPIMVSDTLAVVPEWEDFAGKEGQIILRMDPGMAFGTGTHETTALCLETLDGLVKGGERVLDIGTGSGILAIAALKLGAAKAEGVDIDPMCVRTAGENAALNGVQNDLTVLVGDLSEKATGVYDVICANIVANAIIHLVPNVPALLAKHGTFLASGIIDTRKDEVIAAVQAAGLALREVKEKNGWVALVCGHTGRE